MEEPPVEELEPLFDYRRIQPIDFVYIDDDVSDSPPVIAAKRKRVSNSVVEKKGDNCTVLDLVDETDKEEEDWLPPPPKRPNDPTKFEGDSTIEELRLKKQELASFARSAEDVMREVEESARHEIQKSSLEPEGNQAPKFIDKREKIVIKVQNTNGEEKQFRVFKDDKFERLFKMYSEKIQSNIDDLAFCFDGDKIDPNGTPENLGLEDEDIIEVHKKWSKTKQEQ